MVSDRRLRVAAAQGAVLAAGAATAWAGLQGLYASAVTAGLAGAALVFALIDEVGVGGVRSPRAEAAPRPLEASLLRALVNEVPTPLLLLQHGGVVHALNRDARMLFATDDRLVAPPPDLLRALREEVAGGRSRLSLAAHDGDVRIYTLSLADVETDRGSLRIGALLDVQAEVHAAEADTLRRVLQVLSHELMNSLTPVTSLAESAAELLASAPDAAAVSTARTALATIGRRADGLSRFIDGYRAATRLPEPRLRAVNVTELVEDVVRLVQQRPDATGVRVTLDCPPEPLVRVTDPDLLAQALTNLVVNAVEAVSAAHDAEVSVIVSSAVGRTRIVVSDTGPGVPSNERESIFLPLVTSKPEGSGVGLHLARTAMRSLGGDILLEHASEGARRSRFTILI